MSPANAERRQPLPHPECAGCLVVAERVAQRLAQPLPAGMVVKRCACGRAYTLEEWRQLERKGLQMLVDDGACLDLRACAGCGSCIALPMRLTYAPEVFP